MCISNAVLQTVIRSKGVKSGNAALETAQMFISLAVNIAATGLIWLKVRWVIVLLILISTTYGDDSLT